MFKIYYKFFTENTKDLSNEKFLLCNLPQEVLDHINKKQHFKKKYESLFLWNFLDEIIYENYHYHLKDTKIYFNENGKPSLKECFISLSHTSNLCVIGISDTNIGLDVEKIRPLANLDKLVNTLFIDNVSSNNLLKDFWQAWTSYEANLKYEGKSLGYPKHQLGKTEALFYEIKDLEDVYIIAYKNENMQKCMKFIKME